VPNTTTLRTSHQPPTTAMAANPATVWPTATAPRRRLSAPAAAASGISATPISAKALTSSPAPNSAPAASAGRARPSPVAMPTSGSVAADTSSVSRLSLLTAPPMWASWGTASVSPAAATAGARRAPRRRPAAKASSGSGAIISADTARAAASSPSQLSAPPGVSASPRISAPAVTT